ncbi:MAG TPA: hypothetical protein VEJ20_06065 [Candidatus Eremiobacteraceae bacterium]|nr:hypothetical protein [Candidatus Eremiobacteraceae bacterium]
MPSLSGLSYRSIGPAIGVGRTTVVIGSETNDLLYYAGGADGGVYKTTDGGFDWAPMFDGADAAAIGSIAIAPGDDDNVWVGTGEPNPRNDVEMGDGIWHSVDGGKTWKHLGLDDAGSISRISIDPRNPNHIVVAALGQVFRDNTTRGIYVTADGGAHWQRTLFVDEMTGASDLARVPGHPDTLFAGLYALRRKPWTMDSGGMTGGIYRSDDAGYTWHQLQGHGLPPAPYGRIGITAGRDGRVYAIIQSKAGDLWRSDDGGANWRLMPHSEYVGARRFYFDRITIDPANPDRLISVGLDLSMTTDGAKTFKQISTDAGWDFHLAWWSGDGKRVGVGTDEGVILSADGAASFHQPYDLPFGQAYHIGFDEALPNYHVCIGLQDDSSWCGAANSDTGIGVLDRDWWTVGPGDGMWALYDPVDPHLIWNSSTSSGSGQIYLYDTRTQQSPEVSPDAELSGGNPASILKYRFNWDSPIAFTADGKALVGGNVVFESADHGQTWTVISPDLTRNDKSHQQIPGGPIDADMSEAENADNILSVATSPIDASTFWVGTDDGVVQVTRDAGAHWTDVTPPAAPHWGRVPTVEPGRFDASTAFATFDNHMLGDDSPHVYVTHDAGATWTSIAGDLPHDQFLRVVRQDPTNADLLYAGTNRAVYASWDGGAHWRSLRLNMPASAIYDIEIQPQRDDLLVATHGRGAWIFDDLRPLQQAASTQASTVTLFALRDTYRWWQWAPINTFKDGSIPPNLFLGPNVKYGALITYYLAPGTHKNASVEIVDASGHVIRHIAAKDTPHAAGYNRMAWDLNEDGPEKWHGTFQENQGPDTGAEAMPGTYTIRLSVDGVTQEQHVTVLADPRDPSTTAQMQQRHDTIAALMGEIGGVDHMLNAVDARLASRGVSAQQSQALTAFRRQLTYPPRNVEDLGGPGGLRDRLTDLEGRIAGSSLQAPTADQLANVASLAAMYAKSQATFATLK